MSSGYKLIFTRENAPNVEITFEKKGQTIPLGRNHPQLAPFLDAFVSRHTADITLNEDGIVTLTSKGANPLRVHKTKNVSHVLRKGETLSLDGGDVVELTFNPVSQIGKYPFTLVNLSTKNTNTKTEPKLIETESNEVRNWLKSMGEEMEGYVEVLMKEGYNTVTKCLQLQPEDLKEMKFSLYHRKLIQAAIAQANEPAPQPSAPKQEEPTVLQKQMPEEPPNWRNALSQEDRRKATEKIEGVLRECLVESDEDKLRGLATNYEDTILNNATDTQSYFHQIEEKIDSLRTNHSRPEETNLKRKASDQLELPQPKHTKADLLESMDTSQQQQQQQQQPQTQASVQKQGTEAPQPQESQVLSPDLKHQSTQEQPRQQNEIQTLNLQPEQPVQSAQSQVNSPQKTKESLPQTHSPRQETGFSQHQVPPAQESQQIPQGKTESIVTDHSDISLIDLDEHESAAMEVDLEVQNATKEPVYNEQCEKMFQRLLVIKPVVLKEDYMDEITGEWKTNKLTTDLDLAERLWKRQLREENELQIESKSIDTVKKALNQLGSILKQPLGNETRMEHLRSQYAELESQCKIPETVIVVMGDTGAGKSTTLNAVLGEESLLPTNGMRACTAVIIEMRYNREQKKAKYIADIEFLTHEEWRKELDTLFSDIHGEDGNLLKKPDPRSEAGIALAKIRVVYGANTPLESVDQLMRHSNSITKCLGKVQQIKSNSPKRFRNGIEKYADSTNLVTDLAHWPIVKRISLRGPWDALRSGAVLVDAPGVRDNNSARDNIVKGYLRTGNSIWIVANIKRAVDDRTAKDMLGEGFRRQLLMDGQYGSLSFIATHADVVNRSELIRNLGLDESTSKLDCARARNEYTRARIKDDFKAGLQEMVEMQGGDPRRLEEAVRNFQLPVFTVSSMDFQKLIGNFRLDGPPETFDDIEGTEIPMLRRYVYDLTVQRRYDIIHRFHESVLHFLDNIAHFLQDKGTTVKEQRDTVLKEFNARIARFKKQLEDKLLQLGRQLQESVKTTVLSKLPQGIQAAEDACLSTINKWGMPVNRSERSKGGYHYSTYNATCKRDGAYSSPTWGPIDFNQQLAEPVYRFISVNWDQLFGVKMNEILKKYQHEVMEMACAFNVDYGKFLERVGIEKDRVIRNVDHLRVNLEKKTSANIEAIKEFIQNGQKDVNRLLTPDVQRTMTPAYEGAFDERGPGCFARMKHLIASYADKHKSEMFVNAAAAMMGPLQELIKGVENHLKVLNSQLLEHLHIHNSVFWEVPIANNSVKKSVLPLVNNLQGTVQQSYQTVQECHAQTLRADREEDVTMDIGTVTTTTTATTTTTTANSVPPLDRDSPMPSLEDVIDLTDDTGPQSVKVKREPSDVIIINSSPPKPNTSIKKDPDVTQNNNNHNSVSPSKPSIPNQELKTSPLPSPIKAPSPLGKDLLHTSPEQVSDASSGLPSPSSSEDSGSPAASMTSSPDSTPVFTPSSQPITTTSAQSEGTTAGTLIPFTVTNQDNNMVTLNANSSWTVDELIKKIGESGLGVKGTLIHCIPDQLTPKCTVFNEQTLQSTVNAFDSLWQQSKQLRWYSKRSGVPITIARLDGSKFMLYVQPQDKIEELKKDISFCTGTPINGMKLILAGKILENSHTASNCNIQKGNTIHMISAKPATDPA